MKGREKDRKEKKALILVILAGNKERQKIKQNIIIFKVFLKSILKHIFLKSSIG